jgi:hypothetical protein
VGLVLAGFAPMIAGMLLTPGATGWIPVAVFGTVCMLIAAVSVFHSRETARTPIEELGGPYLTGTARRRETLEEQIRAQSPEPQPARQSGVQIP